MTQWYSGPYYNGFQDYTKALYQLAYAPNNYVSKIKKFINACPITNANVQFRGLVTVTGSCAE